jgi:hypothetical protein
MERHNDVRSPEQKARDRPIRPPDMFSGMPAGRRVPEFWGPEL